MLSAEGSLSRSNGTAIFAPAAAGEAAAPARWHFLALCAFLASQAYLLPLFPAGPSWAVWPQLSDLAIGLMLLSYLCVGPPRSAMPAVHRQILTASAAAFAYCLVSFAVVTKTLPALAGSLRPSEETTLWGTYQIFRAGQYLVIFYASAMVPLTPARRRLLSSVVGGILAYLCTMVPLTYFGVVNHRSLVAHLPDDPAISGPWAYFGAEGDSGLATINYNHAYVGCQLILVYVLRLSLTRCRFDLFNAGMLVAVVVAAFFSGSRACFGATLVLAATCLWLWMQLGHTLAVVSTATAALAVALVLALVPASPLPGGNGGPLGSREDIVSRQFSTFRGYEAENLSGRTEIWSNRIEFISEEPYRWIVGSGFASAIASGNQGHMLALHTVLELGVVGLVLGGFLMLRIMAALWRLEPPGRPMFWGTAALLLTSVSQETFYPVPSLANFFGFYLCAVAVVLRLSLDNADGRPADGHATEAA